MATSTDRYKVIVDTQGAQQNLGRLKSTLGGVGAAAAGAFAVKALADFGTAVVDVGNKYQVMSNQLKLITGSQKELNDTMAALKGISSGTFSDLSDTVELYSKLKLATEALGKTTPEVLNVTEKFQQMLALSGADAGTAAGAIRQFGQAMASGTVRGDEFNSIVEALGPALGIMARESGTTVGELRAMSQAGELTAEVFFEMVAGADAISAAFSGLDATTEQLKTRLRQTFEESLQVINEATGASDKFNTALIRINQSMADFFGTSQSLKDLAPQDIFTKFKENALSAEEAIRALQKRQNETAGFFFPGLGFSNQEGVDAIQVQIDAIKALVDVRKEDAAAITEQQAANAELARARNEMLAPLTAMQGSLEAINKSYEKSIPKSEKLRTEYESVTATLEQLLAMRGQEIAQTPEYEHALKVTQERLAQLKGEMDGTAKATKDAARAMTVLTDKTTDMIESFKDKTQEMQLEFDQLNMNPLQKSVNDISNDIERKLAKQIAALEAAMTKENAEAITADINRLKDAAHDAIEAQTDLATRSYEQQRSFSHGWATAFNEYKENATNAAQTAQTLFEKSSKGIEDSIVNFVKTGKFSLKGLVEDIGESLLRTGIQRVTANIGDSIFGGAQQGPQQPQQKSGGFLSSIFGGLFADGGFLPAGKFGIAGENGPELITGPANVTAGVGGGGGAVNLVINAVDARSFKQLVARDPEFIYSVAQQGARSFR